MPCDYGRNLTLHPNLIVFLHVFVAHFGQFSAIVVGSETLRACWGAQGAGIIDLRASPKPQSGWRQQPDKRAENRFQRHVSVS